MKLNDAVTRYIDQKRALGMRFHAEGFILRALCRALGDVTMARVRAKLVVAFLNGTHPGRVTSNWSKKYSVLTGFYRFALARGPQCGSSEGGVAARAGHPGAVFCGADRTGNW